MAVIHAPVVLVVPLAVAAIVVVVVVVPVPVPVPPMPLVPPPVVAVVLLHMQVAVMSHRVMRRHMVLAMEGVVLRPEVVMHPVLVQLVIVIIPPMIAMAALGVMTPVEIAVVDIRVMCYHIGSCVSFMVGRYGACRVDIAVLLLCGYGACGVDIAVLLVCGYGGCGVDVAMLLVCGYGGCGVDVTVLLVTGVGGRGVDVTMPRDRDVTAMKVDDRVLGMRVMLPRGVVRGIRDVGCEVGLWPQLRLLERQRVGVHHR